MRMVWVGKFMDHVKNMYEPHQDEEEPAKLVIVENEEECERMEKINSLRFDERLHVDVGIIHPGHLEEMDCSTDEGVSSLPSSSISSKSSTVSHPLSPSASDTTGVCDGSDISSPRHASTPDSTPSPRLRKALTSGSGNDESFATGTTNGSSSSRVRLRWNGEQVRYLEHYFSSVNAYPSHSEYLALSKQLRVTGKHVQIWFTNRRVKYKRTHRQKPSKSPIMQVLKEQAAASNLMCLPSVITSAPSAVVCADSEVEVPGSSYQVMDEVRVMPADADPYSFIPALPLAKCRNTHLTQSDQSKPRRLEKIHSVIVRDDDYQARVQQYDPVTPEPPRLDGPLDLSIKTPPHHLTADQQELEDRALASSALLHLSGGGYNNLSPPATLYPYHLPSNEQIFDYHQQFYLQQQYVHRFMREIPPLYHASVYTE